MASADRRGVSQVVRIAMYHAVVSSPLEVPDWCFLDATSFRTQVQHLVAHYDVIPLSTAVTRLRERSIHRPSAVITLDDGFQNNHDVALPILQEAGAPAAIFLATGLIGTNETVWFCRLNLALANTGIPALNWASSWFDLSTVAAKADASKRLQAQLKRLPHARLLEELRAIILDLGGAPDDPIPLDSPFRMLSQEAIKTLAATGLIEVGAHTHSHAILSLLSPTEREQEIERSVKTVEKITGRPCTLFAYPNGRPEDYDAESVRILRRLGVQACVTAIEGLNDAATDAMELKRYGIGTWSEDFPHLISEGTVED